ncbi:type II toxin-antitoxin system PemK/MazF family toxin [Pseudomonas guariconensis]|uniref:type II toxin-antitoxin system PemK/MazF family toxin n=1 Tax=Pseudomonas TaxID=286 RepID=UPI001CE49DC8|nr:MULTISPECIES: type II toxin-antitoxin system PemK/MazF family toxin [Pseudomonas]MCO7637217.1 type II toxin-antitoxin system PemK/MazF family toxin [Pseudomonas sp. S 311-6]MCO7514435.1 type II toxin-antitoxin system PemK/MazF family toxin [Pseudomonas putida]MCO7565690.1 type II toxin-antitoxin system PemK/MazF family toxin [Pseudomonas mosselii]MCO7593461.1 type II toxin-antitoxin system PemK/MazF family toxin [Pseudomonas guariconensis]MCO7604488.1 type II toxin-antitoxin system PemK/Maz
MAIRFEPKVGQVLECNYGEYRDQGDVVSASSRYDFRLKPEMVKNRLVMVLNGKIDSNACIVVPLSTTKDPGKLSRGWHVQFSADLIEDLPYFKQQVRWAKADLVAQVSRERLFKPRTIGRGFLEQVVAREVVERVQRAVVKVMNASSLLKN